MFSQHVAIIGAGLSGLTLAIALHQQSIPCTLYDARSAPLDIGGALMFSPNALRILDTLGVYNNIKSLGHHFDNLYFRSSDDKPRDSYGFGSDAKYGYRALRIYRNILIKELSSLVVQAGIPIIYNKKFTRVTSETPTSVTWEFSDTTTATATVLVGADGIHSKVRTHLYPTLEPLFTKALGVSAAVPTSQLNLPADYNLPVTTPNDKHGAFVIAAQKADGSEVFIGTAATCPGTGSGGVGCVAGR
ncbi:hypothetical protein BJX70DRAFT_11509 [Aspergillus crustosus]